MANNQMPILGQLALLQIDFDIWGGETKLEESDLQLGVGGKIPPESLAALGRKKICSPSRLKPFKKLKSRSRRLALSAGMPFLGGFVLPLDSVDSISSQLDDIGKEFAGEKGKFLSDYQDAIEEWCLENPEYEQAIRRSALTQTKVANRFGFEFAVYQVQPVSDKQASKLEAKANGLTGDLFDEINREARDFFAKNLRGKKEVGSTCWMTLARIRDKVQGLAFLDSRFSLVVNLLNETLAGFAMVTGKKVQGHLFYQVLATTLILADPDRFQEYVQDQNLHEDLASDLYIQDKPPIPPLFIQDEDFLQEELIEDEPQPESSAEEIFQHGFW